MELLSPAGTLEKLKTAILFGADAVYAGVPDLSLRGRVNDFDYEKFAEGVEFVHLRNKKAYATINIYAYNKQLKKAEEAIKKYRDIGADAIILSDPGILALVKKYAPDMPVHLSTQANCTNWQAAEFWRKQGISRIILAREVMLEEIREIKDNVPEVELECFVHGAMCMAYSGRCILSKFLSDRSANQGWCSQPCRRPYKIMFSDDEESGESGFAKEKEFEIEQDQNGTYLFNSMDLCLIEHLDKLKEAGISSFKIEGRTKSAYYVAAATKLYRQAIDSGCNPPEGYSQELEKIFNRGYTSGFLFGEEKCGHNFRQSHKECRWQFVGEVTEKGDRHIRIKVHNEILVGEKIELLSPGSAHAEIIEITSMKDAETGEEISETHGGQDKEVIIGISGSNIIAEGAIARKLSQF